MIDPRRSHSRASTAPSEICGTLHNPSDCEYCRPLRRDSNVLVLARVTELRQSSRVNLMLAILSTLYLGVNIVCLILNTYDNECYPCPEAATSELVFHRLEFAATFCFAIVGTLSLIFSPERHFASPLLLKALVFFNICATFVATALVWISLKRFEVPAHQLEYANELTMALVDVLIVLTMLRKPGSVGQGAKVSALAVVSTACAAACVALVQLAVYNLPLRAWWTGEVAAHYLEFSFEMLTAAISFWFCIDNMLLADRLKLEIMIAPDEHTVVMDIKTAQDHRMSSPPYEPPSLQRFQTH